MWRPFFFASLLLTAGLFCPAAVASPQQDFSSKAPAFEFHSGFWVNLHHFLYQQGRLRKGDDPITGIHNVQPASLDGLTPAQQKDWNAAVAAYAADWSNFDLLDNNLALIDDRLADLENCADLYGRGPAQCISGLQPPMIAALNQAAPIYRVRWWPEQDRQNRAWISAVAPGLRIMGEEIGSELAQIYMAEWPRRALRVDVVGYAGPQGAYISLVPLHLVISGSDPRNQGLAAFEVLLRTGSVTVAGGLNEAVSVQCRRLNIPIPRDLSPAILFYTVGELTRRFAVDNPAAGIALPSSPYAYRSELAQFGWSNYQPLLERYWQLYLDGQIGFDSAISRILSTL